MELYPRWNGLNPKIMRFKIDPQESWDLLQFFFSLWWEFHLEFYPSNCGFGKASINTLPLLFELSHVHCRFRSVNLKLNFRRCENRINGLNYWCVSFGIEETRMKGLKIGSLPSVPYSESDKGFATSMTSTNCWFQSSSLKTFLSWIAIERNRRYEKQI